MCILFHYVLCIQYAVLRKREEHLLRMRIRRNLGYKSSTRGQTVSRVVGVFLSFAVVDSLCVRENHSQWQRGRRDMEWPLSWGTRYGDDAVISDVQLAVPCVSIRCVTSYYSFASLLCPHGVLLWLWVFQLAGKLPRSFFSAARCKERSRPRRGGARLAPGGRRRAIPRGLFPRGAQGRYLLVQSHPGFGPVG